MQIIPENCLITQVITVEAVKKKVVKNARQIKSALEIPPRKKKFRSRYLSYADYCIAKSCSISFYVVMIVHEVKYLIQNFVFSYNSIKITTVFLHHFNQIRKICLVYSIEMLYELPISLKLYINRESVVSVERLCSA